MLLDEIEMGTIIKLWWFMMLLDEVEMRIITITKLIIELKFSRRIRED